MSLINYLIDKFYSIFFISLLAMICFFFIFIFVTLSFSEISNRNQYTSINLMNNNSILEISSGLNSNNIVKFIKSKEVIDDIDKFSFFLELKQAESKLKAGKYQLGSINTPLSILNQLIIGSNSMDLVLIPEGLRIEEIINILIDEDVVTFQDWQNFSSSNITHNLLINKNISRADSLNGYLFPSSYAISNGDSLQFIFVTMMDELEKRILEKYESLNLQEYNDLELNLNEIIILASLIERESVLADEQPIISSVLRNRLKIDMLLQSDPSVQYAIANSESVQKFGWWKQDLTMDDLVADSLYNTYKYSGLPDGPIANPGMSAIYAAMEPQETDFIFFVASEKCDGSHRFSKTLAEHNDWVYKYQKNCL
ncbi:MAG: UPF0755 protein [Chloroflexi bacterium]|jgi:UPF0755 protein|nr:MAG: UPF0755 protein [Chloroflexota bacterium]